MGCSSSSTQTVAQESIPGTKPEETNGDTGYVGSNGILAEDAETIEDQMQLPVQSALPEKLSLGPGDTGALSAFEAIQSLKLVAEQVAELSVECDLIHTGGVPESTASDESYPTGPLTLESSHVEVVTAQEVTVVSVVVEELCPAEVAAPAEGLVQVESAEAISPVDVQATGELVISTIPVEVAAPVDDDCEAGAEQDPEATASLEETIVELPNGHGSIATQDPPPTPAPEITPVAEPGPAPPLAPVVETSQDPEPMASPETTSTTEPASEPTLIIDSNPAPESIHEEPTLPEEAHPSIVEESAFAETPLQQEFSAPSAPEPVQVETAAIAAEVVLQAAQEQPALSARINDAIALDQSVMRALENLEGGVGEGAVSQDEIGEAKIAVSLAEANMAAISKE